MDFGQRRGHLFTWIFISIMLLMGFVASGYYALQQPYEDLGHTIMNAYDTTLDSIFVERLDTEFILKDSGKETYLQANVHSPQPYTTLKVYKENEYLGDLNSKGTYILKPTGKTIGELRFIDLITGKEL